MQNSVTNFSVSPFSKPKSSMITSKSVASKPLQLLLLLVLQAAATPTLDALARGGVTGLVDPVEAGLACGSDTAHLSLFGYPPRTHYRGRGAFETMGTGLDMRKGDVAFKVRPSPPVVPPLRPVTHVAAARRQCNFATMDMESGIVTSRRADRHFEAEGPVLSAALDGLVLDAVRFSPSASLAALSDGEECSDKDGWLHGSERVKDVPFPSMLSTSMCPPSKSLRRLTSANPRPVPPF